MDYKIVGDVMQALTLTLQRGEEIYAEAGAMLYMGEGVQLDAQMRGGLLKGLARKFLGGESLFMSVFRSERDGAQLALAAPILGRIIPIELRGNTLLAERNAYLCSIGNVELSIALTKKLGAGFFGGEGFILQRIHGSGMVFLSAGGNMLEFDLAPGETMRVDTGCIVSMADSVKYDFQFVGGVKNALFGGEGFFFATLEGPGKIILQTLPFSRLADRMRAAMGANVGQAQGLGGFGGILKNVISGE
ncbi:MAG TPA: TIGR00266 family protein [Thermoanaerobaculia bacterium]